MMEQQQQQHTNNISKEDDDAGERTPLSPGMDPNQNRKPVPDPNTDCKTDSTTIDIDLNVSSSRAEDGGIRSPTAGGLKTKKSVRWSHDLVMESSAAPPPRDFHYGSADPYVNYAAEPSDNSSPFNFKDTVGSMKDVLGRWGKKVGEATKKAEDLAGNTWQHLKTNPSLADAALGRIAHGTKVLAEGGYERIFRQTFETVPEEQLKNSYACYLSTSAGPVIGVLYVSTAKLAFSSDNPLSSYEAGDKTDWSYYKVIIPLHQLKAVNPSTNRTNSAEKYIQVISIDNHEFWYMGFLNYDGAAKCLDELVQDRHLQSV
ncbi:hypothetical protein ACP275_08G237300 [Erythranthe tilingii]